MLAAALLIVTTPVQPINLNDLGINRARTLDGQRVLVTFLVGKPLYTWKGATIIGTDDTSDGIERTAVLKGKRLDVKEGRRVTVTGTLRVIDHPARRIGKEVVLPWSEIRIEEGK
jgi:hypothetical protein